MAEAMLTGLVFGICMFALDDPWVWLWKKVGIEIPKSEGMEELAREDPVFLFWVVSVLGPIIEEVLFRLIPLYLVGFSSNNYLIWSIAIISSTVFGLLHGSWKNILNLGMVGLILSWLYINFEFTACLVAHMTHNFGVSCFILLKRTSLFGPRSS